MRKKEEINSPGMFKNCIEKKRDKNLLKFNLDIVRLVFWFNSINYLRAGFHFKPLDLIS